jgi:hypothetical protein
MLVSISTKSRHPKAKAVPRLKMEPAGKVIVCSDLRTKRRIIKEGWVDGRSKSAEEADMDSSTSGEDGDEAMACKGILRCKYRPSDQ